MGDRAERGETLATGFFTVRVLPLLSKDGEEIRLIEDADNGVVLSDVFLPESNLLDSELVGVLGVLATGEMGVDFRVSEMFCLTDGLAPMDESELLLSSGRDFLRGFEAEELLLLPPPIPSLLCRFVIDIGCFSGKPPVLLLPVTGIDPEVRITLLTVGLVNLDLVSFELESVPLFASIFLLEGPPVPVPLSEVVALDFNTLETFFTLSKQGSSCISEICSSVTPSECFGSEFV